jgi:hypothetical protein
LYSKASRIKGTTEKKIEKYIMLVDLNPSISITTLNGNGLNIQL